MTFRPPSPAGPPPVADPWRALERELRRRRRRRRLRDVLSRMARLAVRLQ